MQKPELNRVKVEFGQSLRIYCPNYFKGTTTSAKACSLHEIHHTIKPCTTTIQFHYQKWKAQTHWRKKMEFGQGLPRGPKICQNIRIFMESIAQTRFLQRQHKSTMGSEEPELTKSKGRSQSSLMFLHKVHKFL